MAEFFCSDLHGEYDLFMRLLDACRVGGGDTVYVLGDIIDKGKNGFRLLDFIRRNNVFQPICGNHEHFLLQIYQDFMHDFTGDDEDKILYKMQDYFQGDGKQLTWDMVDYLETLPYYIEKPTFIGVHAGLRLRADQTPLPMAEQSIENLVYDRKFKEERIVPKTDKTILFGHTPCCYENSTGTFLKMLKPGKTHGEKLSDYLKIRLDTGVTYTKMLGMLCADDMREIYIQKCDF